jgi:dGTPase
MAEQAKETIDYLFNAYMTMPELLTDELQAVISSESNKIDKMQTTRLIADYIAGMTDRFAFSEHDRISSN